MSGADARSNRVLHARFDLFYNIRIGDMGPRHSDHVEHPLANAVSCGCNVSDTRGVKHRKLDLAPEVTHCSQPWSNRRIHAGHVLNRQRPFGIEFSVESVEEINKACPLKYESNFE